MNIEDEIDKILFDCVVAVGVRDEGTVIDFDTLIIDRRKVIARLIVLIDHSGLETSSETAPVGGNQADNLSAESAGE